MNPITARQRQVLDFIKQHITHFGYPPAIREIGEYMCIKSTNGVLDHLRALERKGYIERDNYSARAIRVTTKTADRQ